MVSSYLQLLERRYKDKLDSDAEDFINFAVDGAQRMHKLIADLATYSRINTRAMNSSQQTSIKSWTGRWLQLLGPHTDLQL